MKQTQLSNLDIWISTFGALFGLSIIKYGVRPLEGTSLGYLYRLLAEGGFASKLILFFCLQNLIMNILSGMTPGPTSAAQKKRLFLFAWIPAAIGLLGMLFGASAHALDPLVLGCCATLVCLLAGLRLNRSARG